MEPTIFANVTNAQPIGREEIFGPVLVVIPYEGVDDAIEIDSDFGLGGTDWTNDVEQGVAVAARVHTGTIGVNTYLPDPAAPFGDVKASGLGPESPRAYQQLQSIYGVS